MIEFDRSDCVILPLVLKRKWFDMIDRGEKLEEYRDATEYWRVRLNNFDKRFLADKSPVVEFRDGYRPNARRMAFWIIGQETISGILPYAHVDKTVNKAMHPEWGEPDYPHFVIGLGGRVKLL